MSDTATSDRDEPVNRPVALENEADLEAFVDEHSVVLLEFYTDGCGICASMEPVITGIAKSTDVAVGTINPRDDPPLIERFDVRSVPLFVLFENGDVVARRADGFIPGEELREWLEQGLSA
ncbi:thioredoxin family protein [Halobacteria archaeon AArc-curdl1]|uniref:Thioredoxin family protein n=1 Tax=Natronosalvus hydrolyticus TaxID=2979988 RepID=A0AAP2Z774_9EURY|nr:thioredoxin family protein [Halobacteria archaeon AArc-curdl1]